MTENHKLTGKTRHRAQKRFGRAPLLVLQVQETFDHWYACGPSMEVDHCRGWRDARVEDLTMLQTIRNDA